MMKVFKIIFSLLFVFTCLNVKAQKFELGKVSIAELKEKQHPIDTSAVGAILFKHGKTFFNYTPDKGFTLITEVIMRIKIYKKQGYDWANFSVPYYVGYENYNDDVVKFSNATTYNLENGAIVKTKLNSEGSFKKNLNEYWNEASITLPNVKEGSVIEFKYVLKSENIVKFPAFNFQYEIPVNSAEYITNIPLFFTYKPIRIGYVDLKVDSKVVSGSFSYPDKYQRTVSLGFQQIQSKYSLENVPALEGESFVDNIENYRSSVHHELEKTNFPDEKEKNFSKDWDGVTKTIYEDKDFGKELNENSYFLEDIKAILKGIDSKEERLDVIFKFVQNKMNWNNDNGYYTDKGVKQAYINQTGNIAEINFILIAMLKSAGIDANPVLLSTLEHGIPVYPNRTVFNYVIASVNVNGNQILLDASHKYTTQNILPLNLLNWTGRLIKQDGTSQEIDLAPTKPSGKYYSLMAKIDNEGKIEGKFRVQKTDYEAYRFRANYADMNTAGYLEKIENDLNGIKINDYAIENKKGDLTKQVIETFTFTTDNNCERIGGKFFINPLLFFTQSKSPFVQMKREMPIYFGYPLQEKYTVILEIPEGYIVESLPEPMKIFTDEKELSFLLNINQQGNKIQISIAKEINTAKVSANYYDALKDFYQKTIDKQNEKIVLKKI